MVSVIIPNYNHAPYLKERIDSVLNQTYTNFEIIILDDLSPDNSKEIIESYRNNEKISKIIYNEVNSGSSFKQWQKGIESAKGEYIWIAESDDIAEPSFLEKCIKELDANHNAVIAFTEFYYIDSNSKILEDQNRKLTNNGKGVSYYKSNIFTSQYLTFANTICNASMAVFRKEAFPKNNTYTNFRYLGDQLFWILVAQSGDVVRINEPLNLFRKHNSNTTAIGASSGIASLELLKLTDYLINNIKLPLITKNAALGKALLRCKQAANKNKEIRNNAKELLRHYKLISLRILIYKLFKIFGRYNRYV